jgi:RNA polymerase sigma factor (sigma-70 family)
MKDYRLTIKVRNNRLLKAIEAAGGTPGGKWCAANGLGYSRVNDLVNMTSSPLTAEGELHRDAARLCEVLDKLPEDLWSNEQLCPLEKNFSEMEMDYAQVVALLPQEQQSYLPDFSEFERAQTKALVSKVVSTLTPREQEVIRMRFEDELTFGECAIRLDVTRERVRQIEAKALSKMRHPARVGMLVDVMDFSEEDRADYKQATAKWLEEVGAGDTATEGHNAKVTGSPVLSASPRGLTGYAPPLPRDGCPASNAIDGKHERDAYGTCGLCGHGKGYPK